MTQPQISSTGWELDKRLTVKSRPQKAYGKKLVIARTVNTIKEGDSE